MANREHVARLKQGSKAWNTWIQSEQYPVIRPDFGGADLNGVHIRGAQLIRANFRKADLRRSDLTDAILVHADFTEANLSSAELSADLRNAILIRANLSSANLSFAELEGADLRDADLRGANLKGIHLTSTDLRNANLGYANLRDAYLGGSDLRGTNFSGANLIDADFTSTNRSPTIMQDTVCGELDFRTVKGLETIQHLGPSHLSINTFFLSKGKLPEAFVRGTGAPDIFISSLRSLVALPIEYSTCFIHCVSNDREFVKQLSTDLQHQGVRCWNASDDLKMDDKFQQHIDESILRHEKQVLVLSRHSIYNAWLNKQVEIIFEKEHEYNKQILFLIQLDDTVLLNDETWVTNILRTRHISDFTQWKDHNVYHERLSLLLHDLRVESTNNNS